jgi:hypothetical protein
MMETANNNLRASIAWNITSQCSEEVKSYLLEPFFRNSDFSIQSEKELRGLDLFCPTT